MVSSEGTVFTRKRFIAHVCTRCRSKSAPADAHNSITGTPLDQHRQGHGVSGREACSASGSTSSHQHESSNPSRWALILVPSAKGSRWPPPPTPTPISRQRLGQVSRKRRRIAPACVVLAETARPRAASRARIANRAERNSRRPPEHAGSGNCAWQPGSLSCFPVSVFVVEDIKARTRGNKQWDQSFSPLEVGKQWFYAELGKLAPVQTKQGWETKALRDELELKKTGKKLAEVWEAHCVDAWVLARSAVGGRTSPDNKRLICTAPLVWHHRQLHRFQPERGGKRKPYGGTLSQGIKRGTLVKHPKWGKATVGGTMDGKLSLHDPESNKRLTQTARVADCTLIKLLRWRTRLLPLTQAPASPAPTKERLLPPLAQAQGCPQAGEL